MGKATLNTDEGAAKVVRKEMQTSLSRDAIATKIAEMISLRDDVVAEVVVLNGEITTLNADIATISNTDIDIIFTAEIKATQLSLARFKRDTKASLRSSKQAVRDGINNQLFLIRSLRELWVS